MRQIILLCFFFLAVSADIYMHSPRGSNDRNCERNNNRNNANRLFNSQNNAAGGYACPRAVGGPETVTPTTYYYSGSELTVEWTAQHGCGDGNYKTNCDVVIQYMCGKAGEVRDGTPKDKNDDATETVPDDATKSKDTVYGVHESYEYYQECKSRERNQGLYIANQNVGKSATRTRQNPNGNRYGFECPEERDYYPYWHSSPWKDIAVITSNPARCPYYQAESENVKGRGECAWQNGPKPSATEGPRAETWYNNEKTCTTPDYKRTDADKTKAQKWIMNPAHGLPAPQCIPADKYWTRSNHLGGGRGGHAVTFNWTIPADAEGQHCVLRVRYNISSSDFKAEDGIKNDGSNKPDAKPAAGYSELWGMGKCVTALDTKTFQIHPCTKNASQYWTLTEAGHILNQAYPGKCLVAETLKNGGDYELKTCNASSDNHKWNKVGNTLVLRAKLPRGNTQPWIMDVQGNSEKVGTKIYLWTTTNNPNQDFYWVAPVLGNNAYAAFVDSEFNKEKAPLKPDPYVKLPGGKYLATSVNTNQYGRTFQDRSYVFTVKKRPTNVPTDARIINLGVRGKRGNIVQVYPSVEYDFVPNLLVANKDDFLHIQWTGSDYNPRRGPNDAEGGPPDAADNNVNENSRADRSNLVFTEHLNLNVPDDVTSFANNALAPFADPNGDISLKLAYLGQTDCLPFEEVEKLNGNAKENNPKNCFKLNAAKTPYFDGGLVQLTKTGTFPFMSTRNNNFSNRDQKAVITVRPKPNPATAPAVLATTAGPVKTSAAPVPTTNPAPANVAPTFQFPSVEGATWYYIAVSDGKGSYAGRTEATCVNGVCTATKFVDSTIPASFPKGTSVAFKVVHLSPTTKTWGQWSTTTFTAKF